MLAAIEEDSGRENDGSIFVTSPTLKDGDGIRPLHCDFVLVMFRLKRNVKRPGGGCLFIVGNDRRLIPLPGRGRGKSPVSST